MRTSWVHHAERHVSTMTKADDRGVAADNGGGRGKLRRSTTVMVGAVFAFCVMFSWVSSYRMNMMIVTPVPLSSMDGGEAVVLASGHHQQQQQLQRTYSAKAAGNSTINKYMATMNATSSKTTSASRHTTTTTTTTTTPSTTPSMPANSTKATIIVALSGEMANNLIHIAHAFCLQLWARDIGLSNVNLVMQHQNRNIKWKSARDDVQRCFPNLRHYDFELANRPESVQRMKQQWNFIPRINRTEFDLVNSDDMGKVALGIQHWVDVAKSLPTSIQEMNTHANEQHDIIRYPYITAKTMHIPHFVDRYIVELRHFLVFDEEACCAQIPDADESVLHYRNFVGELGQRAKKIGFGELTPTQIADELFSHLKAGDKVAITTRIENKLVTDVVKALEGRGIKARVITRQSGVEDFCFLLKAKKELAGMARSTYAQFATMIKIKLDMKEEHCSQTFT